MKDKKTQTNKVAPCMLENAIVGMNPYSWT